MEKITKIDEIDNIIADITAKELINNIMEKIKQATDDNILLSMQAGVNYNTNID